MLHFKNMNFSNEKENSLEQLYVATLASGEKVFNKPNGHIHDTIKNDLPLALAKINAQGRSFIAESVTLEGKEWKSFKVEIDPEKDKKNLFLARRKDRKGLSTFVNNKEIGTTNLLTVILSKNDVSKGSPEGFTVTTAFPGDLAKREPWDAYFTSGKTDEEREVLKKEQEESILYWSKYAFVPDEHEFPVDEGTIIKEYDSKLLRFPFLTEQEKEKQIVYSGLFVMDKEQILSLFQPKHKNVYAHHSTNEFMPKNTTNLEIGKIQKIKIIGRASDEKGDALLVENPKSYSKHPHITLSCAEGVSPAYSNGLLDRAITDGIIEYFDQPVYIDVVEGFENGNKKVIKEDKYLVS